MTQINKENAILSAYIDAFCLVCETQLRGNDEVEIHICLEDHMKNMESAQRVEKFKDNSILKIKKVFYCIPCNKTFATLAMVGCHVTDKGHMTNKGSYLLKRDGPSISYGNLLIDEKAWQGIVGAMCAVCDVVFFDDETEHVKSSSHTLNLLKSKLQFGTEQIYRKIDDTRFQCLTCNDEFSLADFDTHHEGNEHKNLLVKQNDRYHQKLPEEKVRIRNITNEELKEIASPCRSSSESLSFVDEPPQTLPLISISNNVETDIKEYKKSILESVKEFAKNEVNVNFESETALCKKCLENIDFEFEAIESHIEEHKRNPEKRDVGYIPFNCEINIRVTSNSVEDKQRYVPAIEPAGYSGNTEPRRAFSLAENEIQTTPKSAETSYVAVDESPAEFAKKNQLTYNTGNNNAYCRVCLTRVPSSLRCMKEHVAGHPHRRNLQLNKPTASHRRNLQLNQPTASTFKKAFKRILMKHFVDEVLTVKYTCLGSFKVINDTFSIGFLSYHLLTAIGGSMLRCQACELTISRFLLSSHLESLSHGSSFWNIAVITTFTDEFVREVRNGIYHCGFCNLMESSLEALHTHFLSIDHKDKKRSAIETLNVSRPRIALYNQRRYINYFLDSVFGRSEFGIF